MKRWPLIRHVRYWWLAYRVHRWAWKWGQLGVGLGVPNEADQRWLDEIWEGKA
jgi:hypothetical protein